jgi:hypothetical protein
MLIALMFAKRPTAPESSKSTSFEENPAHSCTELKVAAQNPSRKSKQDFRVRRNMLLTVTLPRHRSGGKIQRPQHA